MECLAAITADDCTNCASKYEKRVVINSDDFSLINKKF